ncbi:MAG: cyclic pyranopterin monophosphate synthase MoaC [Gemmatimonadetes bacterium]|nr:cyclic pyranopterin monophosphate synthase MoaC [Gemmatimonadota bacterium]
MANSAAFTHVDERGRARMVDVGAKALTRRTAAAVGEIRMLRSTLDAILADTVKKGDVLTVARLASIGGAKRTSELIPLCHPLALDGIDVEIETKPDLPGIRLVVVVTTESRTGVEMEAMCAVSAGLLTVYDMCKAMDRGMEIGPVRLVHKSGGSSGPWSRNDAEDG